MSDNWNDGYSPVHLPPVPDVRGLRDPVDCLVPVRVLGTLDPVSVDPVPEHVIGGCFGGDSPIDPPRPVDEFVRITVPMCFYYEHPSTRHLKKMILGTWWGRFIGRIRRRWLLWRAGL